MKRTKISSPVIVVQEMEAITPAKRVTRGPGADSFTGDADRATFRPAGMQEHFLYSRAIEAVIWGMPAVIFDMMHQAFVRDAGGSMNEIVYWSRPANWKNQMLTPDADIICVMPFFDMKETGPMVIQIPQAEDDGRIIVGNINDCWQTVIADVGPEGADKGRGGEYLIMPPGFKDNIPDGYIPVSSNYYKGYALLYSTFNDYNNAKIDKVVEYAERIKLYPLSRAADPPPTVFSDAADAIFDSTIPYDLRFFESLNRIIQHEPWAIRDGRMIDMLKTIGIAKNEVFKPDLHTQEILDAAAWDAHEWLDANLERSFPPFYRERQWVMIDCQGINERSGTVFENNDLYPVDQRGLLYHHAFCAGKQKSQGMFSLFTLKDKCGEILDGGHSYRLNVPAAVHNHQYWSVIVYDTKTHTFVRNVAHPSRSFQTPGLSVNADGSVDIYFGPEPVDNRQSNWIPTRKDKSFEVCFRIYVAEKTVFDRNWSLNDLEKMK